MNINKIKDFLVRFVGFFLLILNCYSEPEVVKNDPYI